MVMFSPIFCTSPCRFCSTLPPGSCNADSSVTSCGLRAATISARDFEKATKSSFLATKSVSQFSSTNAPTFASADSQAPTTPSAATRLAALLALAPLLMRSSSSAFLRSPPASASAFLHSIIPRPVSSRSSFTSPALISAMLANSLHTVEKKGHTAPFFGSVPGGLLVAPLFHLDEFVARGRYDLLERLGTALEHRVGHAAGIQPDRAARVVVAGDDVVDAGG